MPAWAKAMADRRFLPYPANKRRITQFCVHFGAEPPERPSAYWPFLVARSPLCSASFSRTQAPILVRPYQRSSLKWWTPFRKLSQTTVSAGQCPCACCSLGYSAGGRCKGPDREQNKGQDESGAHHLCRVPSECDARTPGRSKSIVGNALVSHLPSSRIARSTGVSGSGASRSSAHRHAEVRMQSLRRGRPRSSVRPCSLR
jgi:hypothetical protein